MYAIETDRLVKMYEDVVAVNGLDLKIREGELFGFLGPNGAGKTTTIRMLTTLTAPTSGTARVASYSVTEEAENVRARIGVVPQSFSLFEELTPMENLWYLGRLYSMPEAEITKRSSELLKTVSLYEHKDKRTGEFSGGMKQRMSIAAGLLHEPEILFMDEPTTGLDPQSRIAVRDLTRELNKRGITIVYTTHDMEEADKLCDRIAVMDRGKLIALGTSDELKRSVSDHQTLEAEVDKCTPTLMSALKKLPGVKSVSQEKNKLRISMLMGGKDGDTCFGIMGFLRASGVRVKDMTIRRTSLEDVFIHLMKKDLRE